jgi:hypothetical protein
MTPSSVSTFGIWFMLLERTPKGEVFRTEKNGRHCSPAIQNDAT